jgi:hypothetical protein
MLLNKFRRRPIMTTPLTIEAIAAECRSGLAGGPTLAPFSARLNNR